MSEPASMDDDQGFAKLLDEYDSAYRAERLQSFWSQRSCSPELRQRVERAHEGLRQLDSFLTEHPSIQLTDTPADDALRQLMRRPAQLGRFQIVRELGRGGFGIVYLANDPSLNRQVAIKVPRIETLGAKSLQNRFTQEAEIAAKLDHAHIVPVFEVGTTSDSMYIVSLYCPGTNLAQWLAEHSGELTHAQIVELMICICDAMSYCHQRGVLHRDLKPANVLLFPKRFGSLPFLPRINDFGLAKVLESAHSDTASSALLGTPLYMAPEQICSEFDKISSATDVYGLGAILYELLTGSPPFRGTITQILDQIRSKEPISPRQKHRDVPIDLETICLKSVAKRPQDRYPSADEMVADLRAYQASREIAARRPSKLRRIKRWLAARATAAAAGLLIITATIAAIWMNSSGKPAVDLTVSESAKDQLRSGVDTVAIHEKQVNDFRRAFDFLKLAKNHEAKQLLNSYDNSNFAGQTPSFPWHYLNARLNCRRTNYVGLTGNTLIADISHDEKWIAAGDRTGTVCIWNRAGDLIKSFNYSDKEVCAIKFSPDHKLLATAGQDSKVHLWSTGSWQSVCELYEGSGTITSIDWSPDSQRLICGSRQKRISVWDVGHQSRIARLTPVEDTVRHVAFSNEGQLIGANIGNTFALWKADDYQLIKQVQPTDLVFHSLAFSPDSQRLVTVGASGKLVIADTTPARDFQEFTGNAFFKFVSWSPDGRHIAGGLSSGGARLWSTEHMHEEATLAAGLEDFITRMTRFTDDSRHLLSVGEENNAVTLWDVGSALGYFEHYPSERTLAWRKADEGIVYAHSTPSTTRIMRAGSESSIVEIAGATTSIALSADGQLLARAQPERLEIWSISPKSHHSSLPLPPFPIVQLSFSPDGRRLLALSQSCDWALYDLSTSEMLASEASDKAHYPPTFDFSSDGRFVLLRKFNHENDFQIRQLSDFQSVAELPDVGHSRSFVADPTFKKVYFGARDGIVVYDWEGKVLDQNHFLPRRGIEHLSVSPDGQTLAAWVKDEGVFLWDVISGQELFCILDTKSQIDQLRFISNEQLVCHRNYNGIDGLLIFNP